MYDSSTWRRWRSPRTSTDQTRLQASLISQKHCAIRPHLPAELGFRQGQPEAAERTSGLDSVNCQRLQAPTRQIGHEARIRTALSVQTAINAASYAERANCRAIAEQHRRA